MGDWWGVDGDGGERENSKILRYSDRAIKRDEEARPARRTWVALEKVEAAPVSSLQRVWLVKTFVVPRMFYRADHCEFGKVLMESLDRLLRNEMKAWLGLPRSTCNGLLYARAREGGFGVQKFGDMVPAMQAKRLWNLLHSEDRVIRDIAWHCRG